VFECENCKKQTTVGDKRIEVVVESRPKTYTPNARGARHGAGWEIVKTIRVGSCCVDEVKPVEPVLGVLNLEMLEERFSDRNDRGDRGRGDREDRGARSW